ncbi:hypothetical protein LZ012_05235 [Dechloromonas sp. XY25]|uniref:Dihydroorotate dehydrogenase n=1 Tax=Dechloromonas hankyongensis TaxID=2908002 RepID=A0ABS9JZP4_9RHOO|nr:hypothetical protein [Dechloromonas hankyongensis]MCG2576394.1 hypothetical protein [Dechloromonas hankyongensis]
MHRPPWLGGVGLAGGIDKTGERAGELLAAGFASVEFGSVTTLPLPGISCGLAALLARLAAVKTPRAAIGIGLGLPPDLPAGQLAEQWLSGLHLLAARPAVADYLSFNLSAAANRRFVEPTLYPQLAEALAAVAEFRQSQAGRHLPLLAAKLSVAAAAALWDELRAAGLAQVTVVLPDGVPPAQALAPLAGRHGLWRVAVGGIASADERRAAHSAGADGVQVHRLFVAHGAACLMALS